MKTLLKVIVVLALIAAIPLFWMNLDYFGIDPSLRFYVIGGGVSVFLLGVLYKMLGSFDLIPDWLPIIGGLDDMLAWLLMLGGLGGAAAGYYLF